MSDARGGSGVDRRRGCMLGTGGLAILDKVAPQENGKASQRQRHH